MLLVDFLNGRTLDAVETLPDDRLINVVVNGGALYGVEVDNIPVDAHVTRREPVAYANGVITVGSLSFDAADYVMLG